MAERTTPGRAPGKRTVRIGVAVAVAVAAAVTVPFAWGGITGSGEDRKPEKRAQSGPAGTAPEADFDGDGFADLATLGEFTDHIAVSYGAGGESDKGAGGQGRRQSVGQEVTGAPEKNGDGISFADHVTTRDLDSDGYTDLVADSEVYDEGSKHGAKSGLLVLWGSEDGLDAGKGAGTYLGQVPDDYSVDQPGDHTLTGGDFDGDGHADLVVQAGAGKGLLKGPFTREGKAAGTGKVPKASLPDEEDLSDGGVSDTVTADMNGDGVDDLISVHEFEDNAMGGGKFSSYTPGGREGFGKPDKSALPGIDNATSGDVDNDGFTDLVLRRHPEDAAPDSAVQGPAEVFYGSEDGPEPEKSRHTEIDQDTEGVPGEKKDDNDFAAALDAGDVDGDGRADVAVGGPGEARKGKKLPGQKEDSQQQAGAVTLLHGGEDGLTGEGAQTVDQATGGSADDPETKDAFGTSVRLLDTDGDDRSDLAAGAPGEDEDTGAVRVLRGSAHGFTCGGARSFAPRDFDIPENDALNFAAGFGR